MSTRPKIAYKSAGMPTGTREVHFFRPANPEAPAPAGGAGDTDLGVYLLETAPRSKPTTKIQRMGTEGQDTDFALVNKQKTMTATAQLATARTPTLENGDYCEDSFDVKPDGTAEGNERYVIETAGDEESAGDAHKQSLTLCLDEDNSARWV